MQLAWFHDFISWTHTKLVQQIKSNRGVVALLIPLEIKKSTGVFCRPWISLVSKIRLVGAVIDCLWLCEICCVCFVKCHKGSVIPVFTNNTDMTAENTVCALVMVEWVAGKVLLSSVWILTSSQSQWRLRSLAQSRAQADQSTNHWYKWETFALLNHFDDKCRPYAFNNYWKYVICFANIIRWVELFRSAQFSIMCCEKIHWS